MDLLVLLLFNAKLQCQQIVNRIIYFQLFYMKHVFEKSLGMKSWSDKISAFLKGPGWFPGTERLGDLSMVPEVQVHILQCDYHYNWFRFGR